MYKLVNLKDVCNVQSGGTPSRKNNNFFGGDIKWAKISDLETAGDGYIYDTEEYITKSGLEDINNRIFEVGTLFLAMYGSVGKTALTKSKMSCNQAILGIIPKNDNEVSLNYLKYWFDSVKERLLDQARGVALKNLSAGLVKDLVIPLPPIETQKRIAEILDNAAALRDKTAQLLAEYDALAQSLFLEMFGDPVTNPKGWEVKKGKNLFNFKSGKFLKETSNDTSLYPVYGGNGIKGYSEKYLINFDTFTIGRVGAYCGVIHKIINQPIWVTDNAIYISEFKENIIFSFLHFFLENFDLNRFADKSGQPKITQRPLKEMSVILPPIELQNEFAEKVALIEKQKELAKKELQESEDLFNALLQKAFKGELV